LSEVKLNRGGAAEDTYPDLDLLLFGLDLIDDARKVCERAVDDTDVFALFERDSGLGLLRTLGHLRVYLRDVLFVDRHRIGSAKKAGYAGSVLYQMIAALV